MIDRHISEIKKIIKSGVVLEAEPMSKHTSFKIGGEASLLVMPTFDEAAELIGYCRAQELPITILGNGSNVLVSDNGIEGVTIVFAGPMSDIDVDGEKITAQAGVSLATIAARALKEELTGFEFAAGIPGSLGGGILMNAGAYGGEMAQVLERITVLTVDGKIIDKSIQDIEMSYRHTSMMEDGDIILSATIRLKKGDATEIKATMDNLREQRVSKQPLEYPSAGSTFKRPEGYFAGKLIQDSGLAGASVGGAEVSTKHCGFVINKGGASAADVYNLITMVADKVYENFSVKMEPEVRFIGDFSK